jgi:homoserine dehydrogenase
VRLLRKKREPLRERGIDWRVTGLASRRLGWIADERGIDVDRFGADETGAIGAARQNQTPQTNIQDWLRTARANVVFEATSLEPRGGQPAIDHIRAALEQGAHAITANKGPIVHAYDDLRKLARARGKQFLFESTVMDGVPIFSLFRQTLPVIELRGFHGILNSTTNVILDGMERSLTFEAALQKAQEIGVAESNASHDIEGWDAAVKVAALVRVLMNAGLQLSDIQREGIAGLSGEQVMAARREGMPYKLVCRARKTKQGVTASVRPERVPLTDAMAWVGGTSSIVYFETDVFPGLVITEIDPGVDATAYGMLADFVRAVESDTGKSSYVNDTE